MNAALPRTTCTSVLLVVPAFVLAACGGSESNSASTATTGVSGRQGVTAEPAGGTTASGSEGQKSKGPAAKRRRGNAPGSPPVPRIPAPGAAAPRGATPPPAPGGSLSLTPEQLKEVKPNLRRQARLFCKSSTLAGLAKFYGIDAADPNAVAKKHAAAYPAELRGTVAAGCKEGLLESK